MDNTTNTTTDAGISFDEILFYCSGKLGMNADGIENVLTVRRIKVLADEGKIVLRVKTVTTPEVFMPESCKSVSMFDTWSARSVTIRTWHLAGVL